MHTVEIQYVSNASYFVEISIFGLHKFSILDYLLFFTTFITIRLTKIYQTDIIIE